MTNRLFWILFLSFLVSSLKTFSQLDITVSDTTVCKATTFSVCAATPSSTLSNISFDDEFSSVINIGFPFTFYGQTYTQCVISDNNFISFNTALAGQHSEYVYQEAQDSGELNNVIMFPFQDLNVATYPASTIRFMTTGKAPNRKFVIEFCRVGYYQCTNMETINQLILYETSNLIEMHINKKANCTSWPSPSATGKGVQGVRATTNASGVFVTGRGPTSSSWTVTTPEAKRFTPTTGSPAYTISNITYSPVPFFNPGGTYTWYKGNNTTPYANTNCISITTDTATDYYIAKYTGTIGCNSTVVTTIYDTLNINYLNPYMPLTLSYCSNQLPVTWNGLTIPAGTSSQNNYDTLTVTGAAICDTNFVINLNIQPATIPAFTQVSPICTGTTLTALPTTSTNGINGTWSPAPNNNATTTYTFTPTAGQCAVPATMTITVNPNVTPAFTQVAPICAGATLAALPTTSNNGITGTWTPALNNTATTTYTFTPTTGQCASSTTMTVTVNPNITPAFTQVATICAGATLAALPTTSTNGITGTWTPAVNNNTTTTYTFTPTAGLCATSTTMTITVNPNITPAFTQVSPICAGATLAALPTTSTNGITGTWSPAVNNNATTTYTFTPTTGQCASATTMTITVNPNITPAFTQVSPICVGATLAALPTTSNNGITGTWTPALNNNATTTYTFTPTAGQCAVPATMTITVNPNITPAFTQVAPICAGTTLAALPTTSTNGITGTWTPAVNNSATTTYTFTPTAGQCAVTTTMTITVNPVISPSFTPVGPVCAGAASPLNNMANNGITGTWSPVWNNTATTTYTFTPNPGQCAQTTTMTVVITPNTIPLFTQVPPVCIGTILAPLPTTSNNGVAGTWAPALNNTATTTYTFTPATGACATTATMTIQINNNTVPTFTQVSPVCAGAPISSLPTTSNNGINGSWTPALNNTTTTTYTFTPTAGACAVNTTMTIVVNPIVNPVFTQVPPICAGAALAALPTTSNNGINGTWSPALNNAATTTYTFTPSTGQCANTATMTITVNPNVLPVFTPIAPICAGTTLAALPTTSNNGISGTWTPALNNTVTTTYTFTPSTGQCAITTTMTIVVNPPVVPAFTAIPPVCTGTTLTPLPTISNNGINGTWSPALNNTATTTYTFTPSTGQCAAGTTMTIIIKPYLSGNRNIHICQGGSYTFNGITYTTPVNGVKDTIPNPNACDSIITLNLFVHPKTYGVQTATICQGSTYTFNGIVYTNANNTAKDTLVNAQGCDSIVSLNLTVIPVNPVTTSQTLVNCGHVFFNGVNYTGNATVLDTLHTILGCDSIYRSTQITVYPEYHFRQIADTMGCDVLVYNGETYTQSTLLKDTFTTVYGCDSLIRDINIRIEHFDLRADISPLNPYEGQTVTINTYSADGQPYNVLSWTPAAAFPDQQNLYQSFKASTAMNVVITGTGENGCTDTAMVKFKTRPYRPEVMMPNAFSPNGDGINDVFAPVLAVDDGYQLTDFRIFNRWGQLLFSTTHVNVGWDGTFKGQLQSQDVYFYSVTVIFLDGTLKTFKGDVTLLH